MTECFTDLREAIAEAAPRLLAIGSAASAIRPREGAWSAREIIGHLIDSAANNHPRFVRGQLEDHLDFAGYGQEEWVSVQQYQSLDWKELVGLWRLYNLHLANVMEAAPADVRLRPRTRHSLDRIAWKPVPASEPVTLDDLMHDYVGHLRHHLAQIYVSLAGPATTPGVSSYRITAADALERLPGPAGERFAKVFGHGSLDIEVYAPRDCDPQSSHTRDEAYIVVSGSGTFVHGETREPFSAGDYLFVAAGVEHRFEDFTDDLVVWVVFYGPEGGEPSATGPGD
jgi:mannose-6-phosphate isomerase-like protein (cupin superfamily)